MSRVFFTDRDLGRRFPEILQAAGLNVQTHHAHFEHDTADETWLQDVGQRGWIVLSHDQRIRYRPNEVRAVQSAGVALLVLVGHTTTTELAQSFVNTLARVERFLSKHQPPLIAKVYRPIPSELLKNPSAAGRIEKWM